MLEVNNLTTVLPEEVLSRIDFLVTVMEAIGGLAIIYLVWVIINAVFLRKKFKQLREMQDDLKKIKRRLKIKN